MAMWILKSLLSLAVCLLLLRLLVAAIERSVRLDRECMEKPVLSDEYRLRRTGDGIVLQRGYYIPGESGLHWVDTPIEDSQN